MADNRCDYCTDIIPEGIQVCPKCSDFFSRASEDEIDEWIKSRVKEEEKI